MESNIIRQKETIYFFGKEYNADKYVKTGLSTQEEFFSWTDGKIFELSINLSKMQPKSKVHAVFKLVSVFTNKQQVIVSVNKADVYNSILYAGDDLSFDFLLPKDRIVNICIELPDACSPKSLNMSEDARDLALAIKVIEFISERELDLESDIIVQVNNLTKNYKIYNKPIDRLKESLSPFRKKYHQKFTALNNISFSVRKGETIGIIGKNGSGKSTLLKVLTGVLTPSSGSVKTNGKISALLELGAGFNPDFTGIENIYFNGSIMGYTKEEIDNKLDEIIKFADIGDFINQPVKIYSSGMYVRLAFSLAINVDPDILIVDEALAVGDVAFQAKCYKYIEGLKEKGTTIIIVTHAHDQVLNLCSRAILLQDGTKIMEGDPNPVVNKYLDLLFGNKEPEPEIVSKTIEISKAVEDVFHTHPGYNKNEFIWGNGKAKILDYIIRNSSGELYPGVINSKEETELIIKVLYKDYVEKPVYGLLIKSLDGIYLFGTNSLIEQGYDSSDRKAGDLIWFKFKLRISLSNGNYMLSFGVSDDGGRNPLNRRYDSVIINVQNRRTITGLFDMKTEFEEGEV